MQISCVNNKTAALLFIKVILDFNKFLLQWYVGFPNQTFKRSHCLVILLQNIFIKQSKNNPTIYYNYGRFKWKV